MLSCSYVTVCPSPPSKAGSKFEGCVVTRSFENSVCSVGAHSPPKREHKQTNQRPPNFWLEQQLIQDTHTHAPKKKILFSLVPFFGAKQQNIQQRRSRSSKHIIDTHHHNLRIIRIQAESKGILASRFRSIRECCCYFWCLFLFFLVH